MDDDLLLRTADRNLRRKYAADIAGLTTFADGLASSRQSGPVTITSSSFEGGAATGLVTMPLEIWLAAAEALLADPKFNLAAPPRPPRVILPDYSRAQAV